MAASIDECIAQFPRQACCLDRVYSRLLGWAAYITAQPMPPSDTAPEIEWVQQRVLAERTPAQASGMVQQVAPYLMGVPNVTNDVRSHLNAWNDEATEATLASEIDAGLAVVMPKIAASTVSDQEVANWCDKNGYPRPPGLSGGAPMPMMMSSPSIAPIATRPN